VSRGHFRRDLWRRAAPLIREVLWKHWDPIGGAPVDEYDSYIPRFLRLLDEGADKVKIARRLQEAAESMACPISNEKAFEIAEMLLALDIKELRRDSI
jgi:hypothetical protein